MVHWGFTSIERMTIGKAIIEVCELCALSTDLSADISYITCQHANFLESVYHEDYKSIRIYSAMKYDGGARSGII